MTDDYQPEPSHRVVTPHVDVERGRATTNRAPENDPNGDAGDAPKKPAPKRKPRAK